MTRLPLPHLLVQQWHPTLNRSLTPEEASLGSRLLVWWQCDLGHEWEAAIRDRAKSGGCPYCAGRRVLKGFNDLATINPLFASQWHPTKNGNLMPTEVSERSSKKIWWQCVQGHEWEVSLHNRKKTSGCPVCSGRKPETGLTDFQTKHPDLALEWDEQKNQHSPSHYSEKSNVKAWWICAKGHNWEAPIYRRTRGNGCPVCAGKRVLLGYNDLSTTHSSIALQWHPTKNGTQLPTDFTMGSETHIWWQCNLGHEWQAYIHNRTSASMPTNCSKCSNNGTSQGELAVGDWLESLGITIQRNVRTLLTGAELDIYLPDHQFAIEYNGLYWHSEAAGKTKNYHKKKVETAQSVGITLFQVWEDDWKLRPEILKKMILHRLGLSKEPIIYARDSMMEEVSTSEAHAFLEENHIQGKANGSLYLGLRKKANNGLVAIMVFKRVSQSVLSLERYATSCRVPGGFTKLLNAACKRPFVNKIITFADLSISDGGLYEKTGFIAEDLLPPDYTYLVKGQRVHKFNYRLKRFREDPQLIFQEALSERQLAVLNKLPRIWDSGKIRFVYTV